MSPEDAARLDDYRFQMGHDAGNLALALDQLTDAINAVALHTVYYRNEPSQRRTPCEAAPLMSALSEGAAPRLARNTSCSEPADQEFALVDHLRRQVIVQIDEQLLVLDHLFAPLRGIDSLHFLELLAVNVETTPVDVLVTRHPADR